MLRKTTSCTVLLAITLTFPVFGQSKRPVLIRDTDKAEGKEDTASEVAKPKEYDPLLAESNINIGNFYFKKKNYDAAFDRYAEALGYQPDSTKAREALQRACIRALEEHRTFLRKNPNAPESPGHRQRITKIEKVLAELKMAKQ
jgi:hypothetical protein